MITISYAILVNDEYKEIEQLMKFLLKYKLPTDEIVVVQDLCENMQCSDIKSEVWAYLVNLEKDEKITFWQHPLNNNFAKQKNYLNSKCTCDYIFNIDADEMPTENVMANLHAIVEKNKSSDVFILPRVNKVENITPEHIAKWNWRVDTDGKVNWPDWQWRVYKNNDSIKWERPVHERLVGYKSYTLFPKNPEFALNHFKKIEKQERQNKLYKEISTKCLT